MSDLFVEVDEALKKEKLEKLWQKYGGLLIAFLATLVLGTAANAGYKSWKTTKDEQQTAAFLDTISTTPYSAEDLVSVSGKLNDEFAGLTKIHAAGLLLKEGSNEKALEIYKDISKDNSFYNLAQYMVVIHSKEISAEDKQKQLEQMGNDENNAWRYHALLNLALLKANSQGDYKAARDSLAVITSSETAPKTLLQKAQSLDILYAAQANTEKI